MNHDKCNETVEGRKRDRWRKRRMMRTEEGSAGSIRKRGTVKDRQSAR